MQYHRRDRLNFRISEGYECDPALAFDSLHFRQSERRWLPLSRDTPIENAESAAESFETALSIKSHKRGVTPNRGPILRCGALLGLGQGRFQACAYKKQSPMCFHIGPFKIIPAATYSPTHLRMQYHRRWQA
jgi:hypothetical protein